MSVEKSQTNVKKIILIIALITGAIVLILAVYKETTKQSLPTPLQTPLPELSEDPELGEMQGTGDEENLDQSSEILDPESETLDDTDSLESPSTLTPDPESEERRDDNIPDQ